MAQVGQQVRWPLPLRRSNRRRCPDSRARAARADKVCLAVRVVLEVSKVRAAPVDKVCLAVRMVSRVCPVVRVVPVVSKVRAAPALRMAPRRMGLRTQLQRRRQQRIPLKTLAPRILIPRLSNEELLVGVLVAAMASGHPYFFS